METNSENFQKTTYLTNQIDSLIQKIKEETGGYSTHSNKLNHPAFLELTKMGDKIVNYIFYQMFERGTSWTHLLLLEKIIPNPPVIPKKHTKVILKD